MMAINWELIKVKNDAIDTLLRSCVGSLLTNYFLIYSAHSIPSSVDCVVRL